MKQSLIDSIGLIHRMCATLTRMVPQSLLED
ncbi:hypothetical protein Gotri_000854 [Gossypium trilobum]|uniref:Uncharacterized protein n=1 Tax=Gossypium trilobum TaxID=34281 RepID=A0A7J9FD38_9ROSI|nr:hypothetical protein [Gossypium trilobum]